MASAFKRDGKWVAKYRDAAGKKRQVRTEYATKPLALKLAIDLEEKARRQLKGLEPLEENAPPLTFAQLFQWWEDEYGQHLQSGTIISSAKKHLHPTLSSRTLVEITPDLLEGLLNGKQKDLKPESLNHLRALLHRVFELNAT
jgi:integrase